jgi:hypothetical protein
MVIKYLPTASVLYGRKWDKPTKIRETSIKNLLVLPDFPITFYFLGEKRDPYGRHFWTRLANLVIEIDVFLRDPTR